MPKTSSRSPLLKIPFIIFLSVMALALPLHAVAGSSNPEFIPLDEITRGMTGYGLTVFEGTTVDTFSVTVIGIQKNNRPSGNMLLVEVAGHGLELSSIAQGMSGSPIFIDGRFAGALAFGWGGALRPIAGVTPAAEILALPVEIPAGNQISTAAMSLLSLLPQAACNNPLARELSFNLDGESSANLIPGDGFLALESWPTPETLAREMLGNLGIQTGSSEAKAGGWGALLIQPSGQNSSGNSATVAQVGKTTLVPGSACAIPLVTGDAQLGATGTVTWVKDDWVFMFGHPFMQRGPVELPLATAEILTIFPSRQMSFKMATMGPAVGAVYHDQRAGISGRLGDVPAMIPVEVELVLPDSPGKTREIFSYDFKVVDDPLLSPTLVFWSLYNSLLARADDASLQTFQYDITTTWEGAEGLAAAPLVLSGITAGPGSVQALASEWMSPISLLMNNSFQPLQLKSVQARFTLTRPMNTARIIGLSGPRIVMTAGDEIVYSVEIEPRLGERQFIDFAFDLPQTLAPGPYRVVVTSAAELFNLDPLRAPGSFEVTSLEGIVDILRRPRARDTLVLALLSPGRNLVLQGQEMKGLPNRVNRLLKKGNTQAQRTLADYVVRRETKVPWALQGHAVRIMELKDGGTSLKMERRP